MSWTQEAKRDWDRADYERRKQRVIDYLGGQCIRCGRRDGLEIDHVDASTKEFTVTSRINARWEILKPEVDKCQLLCEDCHETKTKENGEYGGGQNKWTEVHHGTLWAYGGYGCRCDECRAVNSAYKRENRARRSASK